MLSTSAYAGKAMQREVLKGHLDLLLLATLADEPAHGYLVVERLKQRSSGAFELAEGTVYPALYRLERAGLLASSWSSVGGRRRRVYELTAGPGELARAARSGRVLRRGAGGDRVSYGELARELGGVGIRGRLRRRILAEAADHLRGDPEEFGDPAEIARRSPRCSAPMARRAALLSFGALAIVGVVYAAASSRSRRGQTGARRRRARRRCLGALPADRLRRRRARARARAAPPRARAPERRARRPHRRTGTALVSGLLTLGAVVFTRRAAGPRGLVAHLRAGGLRRRGNPLVSVAAPLRAAARFRPTSRAAASLRRPRLARLAAWRSASRSWPRSSPSRSRARPGRPAEGVRQDLESVACMSGFALFGRAMGIRR